MKTLNKGEINKMKKYLDNIHSQSAKNIITGVTKNNNIDIIVGKYEFSGINIITNVVLKVSFKEKEPYFYCYKGKVKHVTNNEKFVSEWKTETKKGRKVYKVIGEYKIEVKRENPLNNGNYYWDNTGNGIQIDKAQKTLILNKLNRFNEKYKKEVLI